MGGRILRKFARLSTGIWSKIRLRHPITATTLPAVVRLALIAAALFALVLPASAAWNIVMQDNRRYVPLDDVAAFYKMNKAVAAGERFRLVGAGTSIEGTDSGRSVLINGVKYALCFPISSKNGRTLISAMDVVKIIEPILRPQKIKNATAVRTVILDAGHGGHDSGARGPLGREKDAALDVVLRAKKLLEANGYIVRCTRLNDTFIPLEKRAEFANRNSNAIFVSVHFNKSNTGGGTGLETYCLAPRGVPSMDEESLRYSDYVAYPGHARDPENIALATTIHSALVRNLGLTDRGIKRARFVVIKNVTIPGILIEGGFMSGSPDAQLIASAEYRQKIAQCILDGVNRYKRSVSGQMQYQTPSAIISGVPEVPRPAGPVGSSSSDERSIARAEEALRPAAGSN